MPTKQRNVQWFVGRDGELFGPFVFDDLIAGARSDELLRTDLVWRTGMDNWVSAAAVPELWARKRNREPIFLVPALLWLPFATFVAINGMLVVLGDEARSYLTSALAFVPARYVGPSYELPGGVVTLLTSPLTYFLVSSSVQEFIPSSWQLLGFATFLSLHWGKARFFGLFLLCVLFGPAAYVLWNGFEQSMFMGPEVVLGGFQGAALWIKKPDARAIAENLEPNTVRATAGEVLGIAFTLLLISIGLASPIAGLAMVFGFGLGALLRQKPPDRHR
jgi:hypothetical protein